MLYGYTRPTCTTTQLCIVLDLDNTLISTQDGENLETLSMIADPRHMLLRRRAYVLNMENLTRPGDGSLHRLWGITRPHVTEFLRFCFSYFSVVAVWSAGDDIYVKQVVEILFRNQCLPYPDIIFSKNNCLGQCGKPLVDMYKAFGSKMNCYNTVILDDNDETWGDNPDNAIEIPPFAPDENVKAMSEDDDAFCKLITWLKQPCVINSKDVRTLDKRVNVIFG